MGRCRDCTGNTCKMVKIQSRLQTEKSGGENHSGRHTSEAASSNLAPALESKPSKEGFFILTGFIHKKEGM